LKKARCFLVLIFLILAMPLFAKGKSDESEIKTQNDEWFLCITNFNAGSLPEDRINISGVVSRELTDRLQSINYRTRISPEYAYYEEYAWGRARSAAAKTISTKMDERSKQIYMGDPDWKYRQNIVRIDSEIKKLRENLEEIDNNAPRINKEPVFKLTSDNINLKFPDAPEAGRENRFCTTQKADAFLSGSITDFYGRYFLTLKLYTVYTRSFVWEDNAIFSYSDIDSAIDEITRKLIIVLSGNRPAAVAVKAEPEEALVLINRSFAGRGESSLTEYPPGKITVTASAPNYESIALETELVSGELTEINIKLNPIEYVNTDILGNARNNVYHGALYIGESPLTLRLPANNLEYIEMESVNGRKGSLVFRTQDLAEHAQSVSLNTSLPIKKGRVDKERRGYYWAWGSQWITGIAAWICYYSYSEANSAAMYGNASEKFINDNANLNYFSIGSAIAFGAASLYGIYRMIKYIYISGKDSASVAPQGAPRGGNK
jgi:hypothetical protein